MNFVTHIAKSAYFYACLTVFTWGFCDSIKIFHLIKLKVAFDEHYFEIVDSLGSINLLIILLQSMILGKHEITFNFLCSDFSISILQFIQ